MGGNWSSLSTCFQGSLPSSFPPSPIFCQSSRLEAIVKLHGIRIGVPHDALNQHNRLGVSSSKAREPGTDQHGCSCSTSSTVIGPTKPTGTCRNRDRDMKISVRIGSSECNWSSCVLFSSFASGFSKRL